MKPRPGFIPTPTQQPILVQASKRHISFKPPSPAGVTVPWGVSAAAQAQGAPPEEVDSGKEKQQPMPELLLPLLLLPLLLLPEEVL